MQRLIVPVDLGGSPHACAIHPQVGERPTPELVRALVENYATGPRARGGVPIEVAFFRGGVPDAALLEACRPYPVRLACSPADLDPETSAWLRARGVATIEVEALTFQMRTLRECRRGYRAAQVRRMLPGLRDQGFKVGAVLSPGLPGTSTETALADVRELLAIEAVGFVRLLPALAFVGSQLARWAREGRWRPMDLSEAVTCLRAMIELLEVAGVPVIRVGLQPGQDVPYRVEQGPVHPDLRGLVQARRFRDRLATALADAAEGANVVVLVNPRDLSWARGPLGANIRELRAGHGLSELLILADRRVDRGTVRLEPQEERASLSAAGS